MNTKGAPFISSPPDEIVKENMAISPFRLPPTILLEVWPASFPHQPDRCLAIWAPETPGSYVVTYRLRSLSLFQGMASSALMANASAALSSIDDEIPALSNKDRLSSSLRMRTSFWIRPDASAPLTMPRIFCIWKHRIFTVHEQAAMVSWWALVTCMNVIG